MDITDEDTELHEKETPEVNHFVFPLLRCTPFNTETVLCSVLQLNPGEVPHQTKKAK